MSRPRHAFLWELLTEEIPARFQAPASRKIQEQWAAALAEKKLSYGSLKVFITPRRLAVVMEGLPPRCLDTVEERKGPRVSAPQKALEGFADSIGVADLRGCEVSCDPKGDYYVFRQTVAGVPAEACLAALVRETLERFVWPKSMGWGTHGWRWVRPIEAMTVLWDDRILESAAFADLPWPVGRQSRGHRLRHPDFFDLTAPAAYESDLLARDVLVDPVQRKEKIGALVKEAARPLQMTPSLEDDLLEELTGLVEYPFLGVGRLDDVFMNLAPELLVLTLQKNQRYILLKDAKGKLSPLFLMILHQTASAGIVEGHERVARARLSDAAFYWEKDKIRPLSLEAAHLENLGWHSRLGSMADYVEAAVMLGEIVWKRWGDLFKLEAGWETVRRALELAKADLTTGVVFEFPELQGIMGGYLAEAAGEPPLLAGSLRDQYKPQAGGDGLPETGLGSFVAYIDKWIRLGGLWFAAERPTGTKDPYGLRRLAIGLLRLGIGKRIAVPLSEILDAVASVLGRRLALPAEECATAKETLKAFIAERFISFYPSADSALVRAVQAAGDETFSSWQVRLAALSAFRKTPQALVLEEVLRRAGHLVASQKETLPPDSPFEEALFTTPQEADLATALAAVRKNCGRFLNQKDYRGAMEAVLPLQEPLSRFFEAVLVMEEDRTLRLNRLRLLKAVSLLVAPIVDIGRLPKITGASAVKEPS